MTVKSWFLSWFGVGEAVDAAPSSPALYVAGPLSIERNDRHGFTVRQHCGTDSKGAPMDRSWSFSSAEAMQKQLAEFGGAATAPELLAELQAIDQAEPVVDAGSL